MSYSRFATTWPGGADGWYIYRRIGGGLVVDLPHDHAELQYGDVVHLRGLLDEALAEWGGIADGAGSSAEFTGTLRVHLMSDPLTLTTLIGALRARHPTLIEALRRALR